MILSIGPADARDVRPIARRAIRQLFRDRGSRLDLTLAVVRRWGRAAVLAAAVGVLGAATVVEAAGTWAASTSGLVGKLGDLMVPVIVWTLLFAATTRLRRARHQASLLVGAAAAGLAWCSG